MTAEIFLQRPNPSVPWGFRLIGGADSHLPIIVSKVVEGSIAEQAGLEEDVLLERVNNVPTFGLTHAEVNQIILAAEDELLITIKRVDLENLILASLREEESNSEISNILRQTVNRTTIIKEENELEELGLQKEFGVTMIIDNNTNKSDNKTQKEVYTNKCQLPQNQLSEKKWTTFLQKPKNPKPNPRNQAPAIPKSDQYRVIIKKQPKREEIIRRPQFDIPEQTEEIEVKEEPVTEIERETPMELEISLKTHVEEETEIIIEDAEEQFGVQNIEQYEYSGGEHKKDEEEKEGHIQYESSETEKITTDVMIENPLTEDTMSLEEQLAAVQKQLQELAQLPSSIQETLAVVTQQLAHIVGEKATTNLEETDDDHDTDSENEDNEDHRKAEAEQTDDVREDGTIEGSDQEYVAEEGSDKAEMEDIQSDILSDICEEQEYPETTEEVDHEARMAAEMEQQRIEEEKLAKHQLEVQEEERKKRDGIRPIILPGGRKWVDPDDVVVTVKNPKMSDEKICDAIESFSEVIVGKTKGINFLKYTPPPKNLEYLQRSEVYRLVHGMEPPVRGISLRSEKILAEQDYYTAGGN